MNINFKGSAGQGPLARIFTALVAIVTLAAALMFSVFFFAVLAVAGLILWAWFWWQTRALRKAMREQMEAMQGASFEAPPPADTRSEIIEGEAVRVADEKDRLAHPDRND